MCRKFVNEIGLWRLLYQIDYGIAKKLLHGGCCCGGGLHQANYPRKPRGVQRQLLGKVCDKRLSSCCNRGDAADAARHRQCVL